MGIKKLEEKFLPTGEKSAIQDEVTTPIRFGHDCFIRMDNTNNLKGAMLFVDGTPFEGLEMRRPPVVGEANIADMEAKVFTMNYGIVVPDQIVVNSVVQGIGWPAEKLEKAKIDAARNAEVGGVMLRGLGEGIGNLLNTMSQEYTKYSNTTAAAKPGNAPAGGYVAGSAPA